uniref:Uncharacterized protein n=1 Tax=Bracon brevicornis TaxID=1563983 RepID=A0A6V7KPJ4_9HYME
MIFSIGPLVVAQSAHYHRGAATWVASHSDRTAQLPFGQSTATLRGLPAGKHRFVDHQYRHCQRAQSGAALHAVEYGGAVATPPDKEIPAENLESTLRNALLHAPPPPDEEKAGNVPPPATNPDQRRRHTPPES